MRILAITNLYPNPYQPHLATFNRRQFGALAADHQVEVIAPIAWTGEWSARRGGAPLSLPESRRRIADGMIIHHPRYAFTPKVLRGWYGKFFLESIRECFQEVVRTLRPEVVLGCWAYPDGWAAVQLAREAGLPVAVKVHGSDVLTLDDQTSRARKTVEALSSADAVIAVSRNLAESVSRMGVDPARVHTVYNGVDTSLFFPGPREAALHKVGINSNEPLVLFVGNLVTVKGLDVLVEALGRLTRGTRRARPFRTAIVGQGPLQNALKARIDSLGLSDCVHLVGPRPQADLPHWYRAATMLVLPSRSEGIPNVMLEAAACGTPCVATHVGGIPEIANSKLLVPPNDAAALAERIQTVLNTSDSMRTHPAPKPISWLQSAQALSDVLQRLVTETRRRAVVAA